MKTYPMRNTLSQYLISALVPLLFSCSHQYHLSKVDFAELRMSDSLKAYDHHIDSLIRPYRDSMQAEMAQVLVISDTILTKQMPESDLGDLLAGIMLNQTEKRANRRVDVAMINFGGIRLTQLPAGKITREKVYELMPFDNAIVLLELDGNTLKALFDRMAGAGGTPIAGASYTISAGKAGNIIIQGKTLDLSGKYTIAISDYLANGGDKLDMLVKLPQISTGLLLRDAFIYGFEEINSSGRHLTSKIDGRVKVLEGK